MITVPVLHEGHDMRAINGRLLQCGLGLVLWFCLSAASAQQWGETVTIRGPVKEDLYLAGGSVQVSGNVVGDVSAAGGRVSVDDRVSGDVAALGGTVHVNGIIGDDVRIAGGEITMSGQAGDDLLAVGGNINLTSASRVRGRAWLAGGRVEVNGRVGKELRVAGGQIIIAGEIAGNVELVGEDIEIRPDAIIRGHVHYRSPNPARIDPAAEIHGPVVASALDMPRHQAGPAGGWWFVTLSLVFTAIFYLLVFPRFAVGTGKLVADSPGKNLGIGVAILLAGPPTVILLLASLVGLWLGLIALVAFMVLLLFGYLTGAQYLAGIALQKFGSARADVRGWQLGSLALVLVVLRIVRLVPFLGALIGFALMLLGLGAVVRALWKRYSEEPSRTRTRRRVSRRRA